MQNHARNIINKAPAVLNIATCQRRDVVTSRHYEGSKNPTTALTSRRLNVTTLPLHHVATLGVFDSNVMSSYFRSHHVTLQHRNVAMFWVQMNNVVTFLSNVVTLLEIYEQRRNVGHKRRDVAGFSNDEKVAKNPIFGTFTHFQVVPSSYSPS